MMRKAKKSRKGPNKYKDKEKPLTREGFFKMLRKISRPKDEKSAEEKSKTSE